MKGGELKDDHKHKRPPLDIKALKAKQAELQRRTEGGPFWYPSDGNSQIRILPPVGNMDSFYVEGGVHYGVDDIPIVCPKPSGGECPICDHVAKLFATKTIENVQLAKKIRMKPRFYMNVIDRDNESKGPQIFPAGITVFKTVLEYFTDPDYGDMTDETDGRDVVITKSGTGLDTEYGVRPRVKSSTIPKGAMKKAVDLTQCPDIQPKSSDEIEEALAMAKKKDKKAKKSKEQEVETLDLKSMDRDELLELIEEHDIEVKNPKKKSEADLRRAIMASDWYANLDDEEEEEDSDDDDEEEEDSDDDDEEEEEEEDSDDDDEEEEEEDDEDDDDEEEEEEDDDEEPPSKKSKRDRSKPKAGKAKRRHRK